MTSTDSLTYFRERIPAAEQDAVNWLVVRGSLLPALWPASLHPGVLCREDARDGRVCYFKVEGATL